MPLLIDRTGGKHRLNKPVVYFLVGPINQAVTSTLSYCKDKKNLPASIVCRYKHSALKIK
jgi:hypothetical protein